MALARRKIPRIHAVILPYLRAQLAPVWDGLKVGSWVEATKDRKFPLLNVRRLGGLSNASNPDQFDKPVIELTAYGDKRHGLVGTEDLYLDARFLLAEMVDAQIVVPGAGHLHSFFETMGPTQFDSPYDDTWRIQGLIQLGLRPERTT